MVYTVGIHKESMRNPNREIARQMKEDGNSYAKIANSLGVSRQRIAQLIHDDPKETEKKCSNCGKSDGVIHAHHTNYATGEAIWLCPRCHLRMHGRGHTKGVNMNQNTRTIMQRIKRADLIKLQARAERNHRNCVDEISALLDLAEAYPSLDTLPRPEGGAIIPVTEVQK